MTYAHLPTWKKRLAGNSVGCGCVLFFLLLPVFLTALAIQDRFPASGTFYLSVLVLFSLVFLFERSPFGRRFNAAVQRMGLEAAVEDIEAGVVRSL